MDNVLTDQKTKHFLSILHPNSTKIRIKTEYYEQGTLVHINNAFEFVANTGPTSTGCILPLNPMASDGTPLLHNLLFEMDNDQLSISKQLEIINLPYTTAVFTGGKSVHFILCLKNPLPNIEDYKRLWKRIAYASQNEELDLQTSSPNFRTTKIPGGRRINKDGKVTYQELIYLGDRYSLSEIESWLERRPQIPDEPPKVKQSMSHESHSKTTRLFAEYFEMANPDLDIAVDQQYYIRCPCCANSGGDKSGNNLTANFTIDGVTFFINPVRGEGTFFIQAIAGEVHTRPFDEIDFPSQQAAIERMSRALSRPEKRKLLVNFARNSDNEEF